MTTTLRRYELKHRETGQTYLVHGDSVEDAKENCSSGNDYEHTGKVDEIPYAYATIAHAIAEGLSGEWSARPQSNEYPDCGWTLTRKDGLELFISGPKYDHKGKYMFCIYEPIYDHSRVFVYKSGCVVDSPKIYASEKKSVAVLAKDIERRLMPDAERVWALIQEKLKVLKGHDEARDRAIIEIHKLLGVEPRRNEHTGKLVESFYFGSADCKVNYSGSVDISFRSTDLEGALKILAAYKRDL